MSSMTTLQKRADRLASQLLDMAPKKEEIDPLLLSLMTEQEQERIKYLYGRCTEGKWPNIGVLSDVELYEYRHLWSLLEALVYEDVSEIARYRRRLAHTQEETEALFFALNIPEDTLLHTYMPYETYQHKKACIRKNIIGANQADFLWDWIERFGNPEKAQWHLDLLQQLFQLKQHMDTTRDFSYLSEYRQKLRELGDM